MGSNDATSASVSRTSSGSGKPAAFKKANSVSSTSSSTKGKKPPEEDDEILIAIIETKVVGIMNGKAFNMLKSGQELEFRRDPASIMGGSVIEVRHLNKGLKVGSLPRALATDLVPLMKDELIDLEGVAGDVPAHKAGLDSIPLTLKIYGLRSFQHDKRLDFAFPERVKAAEEAAAAAAAAAKKLMDAKQEREASKASSLAPSENATENETDALPLVSIPQVVSLDLLMHDAVIASTYNPVDVLAELFKEGANDPSKLMEHPSPPGTKNKTMRTDLMSFQRQGLAWMVKMEHPQLPKTIDDDPVQLWVMKNDKKGDIYWFNLATETSQRERPVLKRGGLLADEMGLGKTVQTIALIVGDDSGKGVIETAEEPDDRFDDMTLIVCPTSVASNWTDQFHTHVGSKRLGWHLYHGDGKKMTKKQLRGFDVIITTYQSMALDYKLMTTRPPPAEKKLKNANGSASSKSDKFESLLHKIKWRRVVLDEGHVIKNRATLMSLACAALIAERRWILTGTPIVNSASDLGSMMTFLRLCRPLDDKANWAAIVESKSKADPEGQAKLLRAIISSTTLRRTKNMANPGGSSLVKLPPIDFVIERVPLAPDTRAIYDEVSAELKRRVQVSVNDGSAKSNYAVFLVFLLRMRQLACHPSLCPDSFLEDVRNKRNDAEMRDDLEGDSEDSRLQGILQQSIEQSYACDICHDPPENPVIARCEHIFCMTCIDEYLDNHSVCPKCGWLTELHDLVAPRSDAELSASAEDEVLAKQAKNGLGKAIKAAKTEVLIGHLQATEPTVKSLVFSQWTTHLNVIEASLNAAGIVTCRFDGSMTQMKRETVISTFAKPIKSSEVSRNRKANVINITRGSPLVGPPTVMLISLKAGALGLNLTCASQVFLMDPWWQASIEKQAIDRVYRIGQTKRVKIFQLVAENTVEDRVLDVQAKKQLLIQKAFSGTKTADDEDSVNKIDDIVKILGVDIE